MWFNFSFYAFVWNLQFSSPERSCNISGGLILLIVFGPVFCIHFPCPEISPAPRIFIIILFFNKRCYASVPTCALKIAILQYSGDNRFHLGFCTNCTFFWPWNKLRLQLKHCCSFTLKNVLWKCSLMCNYNKLNY